VPRYAQKLAGQLGDSKLAPDSKWLDLACSTLGTRDINVHSNWFPPAASVRKLMLDSTALFLQVREWEIKSAIADSFSRHGTISICCAAV